MHDSIGAQDWLAACTAASPLALALVEENREWTYDELNQLVDYTYHSLADEGVRTGDHVAVLLPNCQVFVVLVHALGRLGAVLVPLNTRLNSSEIADLILRAECSHVVTSAAYAPSLSNIADSAVRVVVVSERIETPRDRPAACEPSPEFQHSRLQAIVFTSGTSGSPKGAMLTYENHFHSAIASAFRLGVLPNDRWLACLPLYHVGGLAIVLRACLYGTAVVLIRNFDSESILESIRKHAVTIVSLVPTMLHRLLESANIEPLSSLRFVLLGGAAASADLLTKAATSNIAVATTYGLTEAASQVATMSPRDAALKPGSVGRPLLFTSLRITHDSGITVEAGTIGEICVRGPGVFAGYYNDSAATAAALQDGELHTGDMGYLDPDGDLWVVQRRSDLIVTGGENVYPAEVERVLAQHPAVIEACVVGLADVEWGQRVVALVTLKYPVAEAELLAFARAHLAGFKIPRVIVFSDRLPMTGSGKVSRPAVIEALQEAAQPST